MKPWTYPSSVGYELTEQIDALALFGDFLLQLVAAVVALAL